MRQLNFYNFRKVNRERTFWIYKHRLFHRDRPEDLHLLRRRTCPGVDGRKNRFTGSQREGDHDDMDDTSDRKNSDEEEDTSSVDLSYNSGEEESPPEMPKPRTKKRAFMASRLPIQAKKSRRAPLPKESLTIVEEEDSNVDMSMISNKSSLQAVREEQVEEIASSDVERNEHAERRVQSHVVSQVAMKLEEYAKKAKRSIGRTRGGRTGLVTPPSVSGGSGLCYRSLITYDDEYDTIDSRRSNYLSAASVVTDGDDSMISEEEFNGRLVSEVGTPVKPDKVAFSIAPVENSDTINRVTSLILKGNRGDNSVATAAIAGFCMSTPPLETADLCSKVLRLLSSCNTLATEFQQYRDALHPIHNFSFSGLPPSMFTQSFRKHDAVSVQQIWERAGSRVDAVRDFKTFAVNKIHFGLEEELVDLGEDDEFALKKTAAIWLKSVVMN